MASISRVVCNTANTGTIVLGSSSYETKGPFTVTVEYTNPITGSREVSVETMEKVDLAVRLHGAAQNVDVLNGSVTVMGDVKGDLLVHNKSDKEVQVNVRRCVGGDLTMKNCSARTGTVGGRVNGYGHNSLEVQDVTTSVSQRA